MKDWTGSTSNLCMTSLSIGTPLQVDTLVVQFGHVLLSYQEMLNFSETVGYMADHEDLGLGTA